MGFTVWGPKGRKRGWDSWEGGSQPHLHHLGGLGERCKLPQWCLDSGAKPRPLVVFLHFMAADVHIIVGFALRLTD